MPPILIIDDDEDLLELLSRFLKEQGFSCTTAVDGEKGLRKLRMDVFDAVILDLMLPDMDGFAILQRLRAEEETKAMPVLMLTARGEDIDRIIGLELGADDYLPKPFNPHELAARLRALLRRSSLNRQEQKVAGTRDIDNLSIHGAGLCVYVDGNKQDITVSELRLLNALLDNAGDVVSRDALCKTVFGHGAYPMDRSLDVMISRLRRKIGPLPAGGERIKAVRGEGYMFLLSGEKT